LRRIYPSDAPRSARTLRLDMARGERAAFQVAMRTPEPVPFETVVSVEAPKPLAVTVRRVGYVPVPHVNVNTPPEETEGLGRLPGYAPDPLWPEDRLLLPPGQTHAFWISVDAPPDAKPGPAEIFVTVQPANRPSATLKATVHVSPVTLQPRRDFHMTHWFYADAICDWHKLDAFEEAFWPICERYMRNYAEHGNDTIYAPVFTPPLDGVKRPTQLLGVRRLGKDRYAFDWRQTRRWVATAQRQGLTHFEWTHLFTQWGAANAIRVYEGPNRDERLLWPAETPATSPTYRAFLAQFLPALHRFLRQEKLLDRSFFHVSDEPHGDAHIENYRNARAMLRELAPWMKVMDALSDIRFSRQGLTDMPIPSIQTALQFRAENIPCWAYFCCGPRGKYLNRLMDTPLAKLRGAGWLFWRHRFLGFLHWGYNYWYKRQSRQMIDPFTVSDALHWPGWPHGDTFVVYPGPDGPLDSIRWETWRASMDDYRLLQTLDVAPDGPLMEPFKSFEDYPKTEAWLTAARRKLLAPRRR